MHSFQNRDGSTGSRVEERQQWQPICQAPCTARLDSASYFRIGGPGIKRSPPFMMPTDTPQATLRTEAGDAHRYRAGLALMILGSASTLAGLVAVSLAERSSPNDRGFLRTIAYPRLSSDSASWAAEFLFTSLPLQPHLGDSRRWNAPGEARRRRLPDLGRPDLLAPPARPRGCIMRKEHR